MSEKENNEQQQQHIDIAEDLGEIKATLKNIERVVVGNGQPGLMQRVSDLEQSRAKLWGVGSAVTFLAGIAEYFIHKK